MVVGASAALGGCSPSHPEATTPRGTAPPPSTHALSAPPAPDLSSVLSPPEGYVGVPGDVLSGPVGRAEVGTVFTDHPGDADKILTSGFRAGHIKNWQAPMPTFDPSSPGIPDTTLVTKVILRFDTSAHAQEVLIYLEEQSLRDGYAAFAVPASLAGGYGFAKRHDVAEGIFYQSVTWFHGADLLQVTWQSTADPRGTRQVVDLAVAQDNAMGPR